MAALGRAFWGPPYWDVLHTAAACFSPEPEKIEGVLELLSSYTKIIPCSECRTHFKQHLRDHPVDLYLGDCHQFFFWTYLIHDLVNIEYTKHHPDTPKKSPRYEDAKTKYFNAMGVECKGCASRVQTPLK